MNNMELTRSVEILNQQYADLNNRFISSVQELSTSITQSTADVKTMYDSVISDIKPVIDAFNPLKEGVEKTHKEALEEYQKIQRLGENTNLRFEESGKNIAAKTNALEASINAMQDTLQQWCKKLVLILNQGLRWK